MAIIFYLIFCIIALVCFLAILSINPAPNMHDDLEQATYLKNHSNESQ